jgi:hypothetical protein
LVVCHRQILLCLSRVGTALDVQAALHLGLCKSSYRACGKTAYISNYVSLCTNVGYAAATD